LIHFLIDENLSPRLVNAANELGYVAFHVVHRGWAALTDAQLFRRMRDEDLTLVTNNWLDFEPMLRREELHAGAVVILPAVRRDRQVELFRAAVEAIGREELDMVNTAVTVDARGRVTRFQIPEPR
jgi:predicted nuclease of predicted toxin-antitoxin system